MGHSGLWFPGSDRSVICGHLPQQLLQNGILPIRLTEAECDELLAKGIEQAQEIEVNLEEQTVTTSYGKTYTFNIDPYYKKMLLNGWDEISLTFQYEDHIKAYEEKRLVFK